MKKYKKILLVLVSIIVIVTLIPIYTLIFPKYKVVYFPTSLSHEFSSFMELKHVNNKKLSSITLDDPLVSTTPIYYFENLEGKNILAYLSTFKVQKIKPFKYLNSDTFKYCSMKFRYSDGYNMLIEFVNEYNFVITIKNEELETMFEKNYLITNDKINKEILLKKIK